jgi:D-glycero-alpha-D-manno-heptose 1-phosphate guanylyltransferase
MAPVNGKPFLSYLLDYLNHCNIRKVILSIGYLGNTIQDYFENSYKNIELSYAIENEALGTGGGIKFAMEYANSPHVLVLNGDTFYKLDYSDFYKSHIQKNAEVSVALKHLGDVSRYGSVVIDEQNTIVSFAEKNTVDGSGYINAGAYFIESSFFKRNSFPVRFSFEKDALEKMYPNRTFYGFWGDNFFIDIGIPADYKKAQMDFKFKKLIS